MLLCDLSVIQEHVGEFTHDRLVSVVLDDHVHEDLVSDAECESDDDPHPSTGE